MTDDDPCFALAVVEIGVLFQEGCCFIHEVQSINLKEKGRSIVLNSASVL